MLINEPKVISNKEKLIRNSVKSIALVANKVNNELIQSELKVKEGINLTNFIRTVSFAEVSNVPSFSMPNNNISFNQRMAEHIKVQLKYPEQALVNNIEGSVLVNFVINTSGEVINIKASSNEINNNILEKEAIRIIKTLPKFIPGKHNGKKVNVSYGFPILFSMDY
ncbi:energy transducer TonB [Tenacibaculum bernardetii]|uniref:energy transducer TonB n=1 Tax=Tenacibaculum bernardetii TaxID=3021375 RepID=UPI0023AF2B2B|nr:energy transducer TonB [Tenacibaculum bernardetii]